MPSEASLFDNSQWRIIFTCCYYHISGSPSSSKFHLKSYYCLYHWCKYSIIPYHLTSNVLNFMTVWKRCQQLLISEHNRSFFACCSSWLKEKKLEWKMRSLQWKNKKFKSEKMEAKEVWVLPDKNHFVKFWPYQIFKDNFMRPS